MKKPRPVNGFEPEKEQENARSRSIPEKLFLSGNLRYVKYFE
jgi:hypothetical protein